MSTSAKKNSRNHPCIFEHHGEKILKKINKIDGESRMYSMKKQVGLTRFRLPSA